MKKAEGFQSAAWPETNAMNGGARAKSGELILAIDYGTQSVRAGLVDQAGELCAFVKTPIEPYCAPRPGWAEQDPQYYWSMFCRTTQRLLAECGKAKERIAATTITTQRATVIVVDRDGAPLRPAIVWLDQRRADPAKVLPALSVPFLKIAGLDQFARYVTGYCRSNWLRQNEPEIWDRTHKFLFLSGYLTHKLTGRFCDSCGNVIGPIPFDVRKSAWARPGDIKWRLFPIEPEKLPELQPQTAILGSVTRDAAEQTGIPEGLPLVAASNDKACDVIGAGCLEPRRACVSFGTTATINTQNERYVELRPFLPPYPSAIPGQYYSEVMVLRGLWMVSWFRDEFALQERLQAQEGNATAEELMEKLIEATPPGSMGLVCQPYWTPGPLLAPCAKGSIIGFGDVHKRSHLYRSIIEGIVFALREGGDLTQRRNGTPITEIRATGGGSKSDSVMQITADVFGLPVARPHTSETAVLGAAMDAAVGLKLFPDFKSAAAAMTRPKRTFEPMPENRKIYEELYQKVYRRMYSRLLPLFRDIQRITRYPE